MKRESCARICDSCCSIVTGAGATAGRRIEFKGRHSFPDSVLLHVAISNLACRAGPSGTKVLIPLPGFHSRDLDEVHLGSPRLLRRKAELADRSLQETSEKRTMPPQATASRSLTDMPADTRRWWRRPRLVVDRSEPSRPPSRKNPLEPIGTKMSASSTMLLGDEPFERGASQLRSFAVVATFPSCE